MWQAILAGLMVLAASLYATWALWPRASRLRMAQRLEAAAARHHAPRGLQRGAARLAAAARRGAGICGDCAATRDTHLPPSKRELR